MIGVILAAIGSMIGFTAITAGEQELRQWLGGMSRQRLVRLNARLNDIQNTISNKKLKIASVVSALQAEGMNVSAANTASKARAKRTQLKGKYQDQDKQLDKLSKEVTIEQAVNDIDNEKSYNYVGAVQNLVGSGKNQIDERENKISKWEDKLNG